MFTNVNLVKMKSKVFSFRADEHLSNAIQSRAKSLQTKTGHLIKMALADYMRSDLPPNYEVGRPYVEDDNDDNS